MAIQYAGGTNINATLTQSTGTRAELAQWIRDQLVAAGWTSSGSATDYQVTSATTPQSLSGRVRVYDPGSGSCARIKMSNVSGTKVYSSDLFLLPATSKSWRIIANKYQFFVFTPGNSGTREFACGGIPYIPSFLTSAGGSSNPITECMWCHGNAINDTDNVATNWYNTFRNSLQASHAGNNQSTNQFCLINGSVLDVANSSSVGSGQQSLGAFGYVYPANIQTNGRYWHDGSQLTYDPLIAWNASLATGEANYRGQLWDGVMLTDSWPGDTILNLDFNNPTYTFMVITCGYIGANGSAAKLMGSLAVRIS